MRALLATSFLILGLSAFSQRRDSTETIARRLMILRSMSLPAAAEEAGIEGTVLVEFTIDSLCRIRNKRVISGLGYGLDEVALKVIDRKFENDLTHALMPCSPDTLVIPIRFQQR